ncbi:MAG: tetratricopeptide repeat protein [Salinivirgaceae bacterium]|jgi:serine phosphatase RsbU (regulator of sigma subunit)|nr:tetratricopeptide repeat protein [Salinivirgaceae bacterium]
MRLFLLFISHLLIVQLSAQSAESLAIKKVQLLLTKSRTHLYSNNDSSVRFARMAKVTSEKLDRQRYTALANKQIGLYHYIKTQLDSAQFYLTLAKKQIVEVGDSVELMKIVANLGNIYADNQQTEAAINAYMKVFDWFTSIHDSLNTAKISVNIGNLFLIKERYGEALSHFAKAQEFFKQLKMTNEIAVINLNTGYIYNELGKLDSAFIFTRKAYAYYSVNHSDFFTAACEGNLSEIYSKKEQYDSALHYINIALKKLQTSNVAHLEAKMRLQKSNILSRIGNQSLALKELLAAHKIAYANNYSKTLGKTYKRLYEAYKEKGELTEAMRYLEKYTAFQDSLFKRKLESREDQLLAELSLEKRDKEIELLRMKDHLKAIMIKKQEIVILLFAIMALLAGVVAFVLLYRNRIKNKLNKLLTEKNEEIQAQSEEINAQNDRLKAQKKEITDSIGYARFIQHVIFSPQPTDGLQYFRFNQPKDIVSGDFFWQQQTAEHFYLAVADCTGHGVAGAFMSVLGFTFLNQTLEETGGAQPNVMLELLRTKIKHALKHTEKSGSNKDGLDVALIRIHKQTFQLEFSGAYRPCWIYEKSGFTEIKGDRQPIGYYPKEKPFKLHTHDLGSESTVYLFTDGYSDQTNGITGKKLKLVGVQNLLNTIVKEQFHMQEQKIRSHFTSYKGNALQIDDILIAGIKV